MFKSFFDTLNSGYELPNNTAIVGTDIFSMDSVSDFRIQTNLSTNPTRDIASLLNGFSQPLTLATLSASTSIVSTIFANNIEITLNFDKGKLTNYAYFGSLSEFIRVSIQNILTTFPASLYITNEFNNSIMLTLLNYSYDIIQNIATMSVPVAAVVNNYGLNYTQKSYLLNQSSNLSDVTSNYSQYTIWNFTDEFIIVGFTGSTTPTTGYITLQTQGNPFPDSNGNSLVKYHIKPSYLVYENYVNGLEDFEAYLLNRDTTPRYTASFKKPLEAPDGTTTLVDRLYTWKTTDGYNLDYNGYEYQTYLKSLLELGKDYDEYKTNLISRFLTTTALKEFDTPDKKMHKLLSIYGREFDEIKKYIDGLANIAKTSYDKKDNIPDTLVKNFAKSLGWGTFNTVNSNELVNSFLGNNQQTIFSGQSKNLTPVETDIELWRRLVINSAYLFKSKGTRNCINFLFKIIGAPDSLIDFNEYVYLVDKKINVSAVTNNSDLNYPFDSDGNPVITGGTPDYYFQMKGGWIQNVEIAPNNTNDITSIIGIHQGNYDNGKSYFDVFRTFGTQKGFELTKTVDNIKSWTYSTGSTIRQNTDYDTNYISQSSKLTLNTKEASIFLDPAKAIESDVYTYNQQTDYVINDIELQYPYPNTILTRTEVINLSFIEYVDFIYTNYINAKNRKVISDNMGGGYPTLRKLYDDYFNVGSSSTFDTPFTDEFGDDSKYPPSNELNYYKISLYLNQIGDFWTKLIEQFIPSTTIFEGGVKYRNTVFDRQKFVYRHGIDDGSEFTKKQDLPEQNVVTLTQISGSVGLPYSGGIGNLTQSLTTFTSSIPFISGGTGVTVNSPNKLDYRASIQTDILKISEPYFNMTQVGKIQTGMTEPIIHNITNGLKTIDFTFTGNTEYFNNGSNPFALFSYNVFPFNYNTTAFTQPSVYSRTLTELSIQTASTRTINETVQYFFNDGDYLVRGSYLFSGTTGSNLLPSGYSIDNSYFFNSAAYYKYGIYDVNRDYWFTIISNPVIPVIDMAAFDTGATVSAQTNGQIVNNVIPITQTAQTQFTYQSKPVGNIFLNLNGSTLMVSSAITFADGGEYYVDYTTYPSAIVITLNNPVSNLNNDVLNIIYIQDTENVSLLTTEVQNIKTIPSGTGATMGSQIYYNTLNSVDEYYFNFVFGVNVDFNQLIVILNGSNLVKNVDYYLSSVNKSKIIFNGTIEVGDTLLFYYPNIIPLNYTLTSSQFTAAWVSNNSGQTGLFTVEVAAGTDTYFSDILYSGITAYSSGSTYQLFIGNITTPNTSFLYRIKSDKYFTNLLNETFTTTTYSNIITFYTDNRVVGI